MYIFDRFIQRMDFLVRFRESFITHLDNYTIPHAPQRLYKPMEYILQLGGKRMRPILVLMGCDLFNTPIEKAQDAALAVEVFHNFSLVHDDIMDDAPLRRGQQTVHEKWDVNTGILSGDVMLIKAYQLFENYPAPQFVQLASLFSKTAIEVCEGQQFDMDFETRTDVEINEYIEMIRLKTSVLVGASLQMGAIVAGATDADQKALYNYGQDLGLAFQLRDDYLDAYGDPATFGKQVGGDIIENKKTYLYLKALELGNEQQREELLRWYDSQPADPSEKLSRVKQLFQATTAVTATLEAIESYHNKALAQVDALNISQGNKEVLQSFAEYLLKRNS